MPECVSLYPGQTRRSPPPLPASPGDRAKRSSCVGSVWYAVNAASDGVYYRCPMYIECEND